MEKQIEELKLIVEVLESSNKLLEFRLQHIVEQFKEVSLENERLKEELKKPIKNNKGEK